MKSLSQGSKTWIWLVFILIGGLVSGLYLHQTSINSFAQETSQPAVEKAPDAKPAEQAQPQAAPKEEPKSESKSSSQPDDQSCIA